MSGYCEKCGNQHCICVEFNTQDKIKILFDNFSKFLIEKNKRYGDSALNPVQIFSKLDSTNSLCIRIDDKVNRIKNSNELRKNDIVDLVGYLSLYMIDKDWLEFKELID